MIDALCGGNDTGDMDMLGSAMGKECFVSEFHRAACGKHGVGNDECLAIERWGGKVFHMYSHLGVCIVLVGAICTCEGIFCLVEHAQYSVVHGKSSTQHCGDNNLVGGYRYCCVAEWGHHVDVMIVKLLAYLICNKLTYATYVVAEEKRAFLIVAVAKFRHVSVDDGVLKTEVDNVHRNML